ncbi:MAG TPA: hypothetical protein DEP61_09530 [Lachnospiraceae bacterium]|nr:hypothetical protein [Lachnospiraceae bacterium]
MLFQTIDFIGPVNNGKSVPVVLTSVVAELDERFEEQYPKNDQSEERIRRKESKFILRAVKKRNQMQCMADEKSGDGREKQE